EARQIDIVGFDPLVKTHTFQENDNRGLDFVAELLANLSIEYDIAVDAPHHKRKGLALPGDAESGRGGGAFKDGGRLVYTLTRMTSDEAKHLGITNEADRLSLIRHDNAKVNLAPPADQTSWYKLVGQALGNPSDIYPNGDNIQTVIAW